MNDSSRAEQEQPKMLPEDPLDRSTIEKKQTKTHTFKSNRRILLLTISIIILITGFFFPPNNDDPVQPDVPAWPFEDPYFNLTAASDVTTLEDSVLQDIDSRDKTGLTEPLLVGIFTSSRDFQRRQIMRAHQFEPSKFQNVTFRFILGVPPGTYRRSVMHENNTYGDLIILENVPDTYVVANSYKTFEYFKYVEKNLNIYKYVAKMDTDTYVSFPDFLKEHFGENVQAMDYAIIGNWVYGGVVPWAQGAFYVLSWKMMLIMNRLYDKVDRRTIHEDFQVALFFYDGKINYTRVEINEDRSNDFVTRWPIDYNTFRIHKVKEEDLYLMAASCFTSEGINKTQVDYWKKREWKTES